MAGLAIALALLLVGVVCVPVRLWASRLGASSRRRRLRFGPTPDEQPTLQALRAHGRALLELTDVIERLVPEVRRTLPYVSLFFADPRQGLHVRRDRWIVAVRQDFEAAIERFAMLLRAWSRVADALDVRERAALDAAGGVPRPVEVLLSEVGGLPRNTAEARRWRFCEDTELEALTAMLDALADDLHRLELELAAGGAPPYR